MISALIEMLGNFYAETMTSRMSRCWHAVSSRPFPAIRFRCFFLALTYYKTGRAKEALKTFDQVHSSGRTTASSLTSSDEPCLPDGDPAAVACYEEATRRDPLLARLWCDLGKVLPRVPKFRLGDPGVSQFAEGTTQTTRPIGVSARSIDCGATLPQPANASGWVRKLRATLCRAHQPQRPRHRLGICSSHGRADSGILASANDEHPRQHASSRPIPRICHPGGDTVAKENSMINEPPSPIPPHETHRARSTRQQEAGSSRVGSL